MFSCWLLMEKCTLFTWSFNCDRCAKDLNLHMEQENGFSLLCIRMCITSSAGPRHRRSQIYNKYIWFFFVRVWLSGRNNNRYNYWYNDWFKNTLHVFGLWAAWSVRMCRFNNLRLVKVLLHSEQTFSPLLIFALLSARARVGTCRFSNCLSSHASIWFLSTSRKIKRNIINFFSVH